jgi:hypothetical protein
MPVLSAGMAPIMASMALIISPMAPSMAMPEWSMPSMAASPLEWSMPSMASAS